MPRVYDVYYDGNIDEISEVGWKVMEKWIAFAAGLDDIYGRRVAAPTGRYASSIRLEGRGANRVAVVADEELAPEAGILEEGHGPVDLKTQLTPGRVYPMHRGAGTAIISSSFSSRTSNVWAVSREAGFNGFARVPTHITPENSGSWIIPAMAAWSPAMHLANMIRNGDFDAS